MQQKKTPINPKLENMAILQWNQAASSGKFQNWREIFSN